MTSYGWRASFYVCAAISFVWVALWALTFTEHPADHPRVSPQELSTLPPPSASTTASQPAWRPLFERIAPVTVVYFCYGWNLWLFLSWIPQYFLHSYHLDLKQSALFSSSVFFAGVVGDTLGGVITDRLLRRTGSLRIARSAMVSVCMLLTALALFPLMFVHSVNVSLACLSAGFFFAEIHWTDVGHPHGYRPRLFRTASGMMNTGSRSRQLSARWHRAS